MRTVCVCSSALTPAYLCAACRDVEPADTYMEDCMYDMCACSENMADCLCPTLGVYADNCAAKGVKLNWRLQISECSK